MREAVLSKEWGEVMRQGRKFEDWGWEVTFLADGAVVDRHCYKTEELAQNAAIRFEQEDCHVSEYGGVEFD